jgi:uncharacterized protein with PQ loop repeat
MIDILYYGGVIAAVITLSALSLQLRKMIITRDTTGISYHLSIWISVSMGLWIGFGISLNEPIIYISNLIGVIINILILLVKYKNESSTK